MWLDACSRPCMILLVELDGEALPTQLTEASPATNTSTAIITRLRRCLGTRLASTALPSVIPLIMTTSRAWRRVRRIERNVGGNISGRSRELHPPAFAGQGVSRKSTGRETAALLCRFAYSILLRDRKTTTRNDTSLSDRIHWIDYRPSGCCQYKNM